MKLSQGENSTVDFCALNSPSPNCMGNILLFISFSPMMQHDKISTSLLAAQHIVGQMILPGIKINNLLELSRPETTELIKFSCHQLSNRILKRQLIKY
jgi:hypothetical protein